VAQGFSPAFDDVAWLTGEPMTHTLVLTLVVAMTAARAGGAAPSDASAIRAAREQSNRAIARRDIDAFARTLAADFVMVRGSGAFVASRQAYIDQFRADFQNGSAITYRRTPDKIEVSTAAPLAAEHGRWVGLNADGTVAYRGTYLAMWRRTDAGWEIRSELFVLLSCGVGDACKSYAASARPR
jgi:ketosteroid isomerase-like protein